MVGLLHLGGLRKRAVRVQYRLGKARRARRIVDGRVVVFGNGHLRVGRRAVRGQLAVALGKARAVLAHVEEQAVGLDGGGHLLDAPGELRSEDEHVHVGLVHTVVNLGAGVAEVQRHRARPAFQHAEVDGQPFEAVHQKYGHLVAFAHAARNQEVGEAVGLLVEDLPGDLATVGDGVGGLDEVVIAPGDGTALAQLRVYLDERHLVGAGGRVVAQEIGDGHGRACPFSKNVKPAHTSADMRGAWPQCARGIRSGSARRGFSSSRFCR